jgi:hypothetical protein
MRQINQFVLACCLLLLAACSQSPESKVLVWSSGKITIAGNNITLEPGTQHNEQQFVPSGNSFTVSAPGYNQNFTISTPGLYVLNLKTDTIVGSFQRVGTDNSQVVITQDELRHRIDSLNQLMRCANVSEANRNFCIPPRQLARISANLNAQLIGPYLRMPASFEGGKELEVYKFSTNKEVQDVVTKLSGMTGGEEK